MLSICDIGNGFGYQISFRLHFLLSMMYLMALSALVHTDNTGRTESRIKILFLNERRS